MKVGLKLQLHCSKEDKLVNAGLQAISCGLATPSACASTQASRESGNQVLAIS
jgi:hypothetical protein